MFERSFRVRALPSAVRHALLVILIAVLIAVAPTAAQSDAARLPSPLYPSAAALYEEGRFADALSALDLEGRAGGDEPPIEERLLRATLLAGVGRHLESVLIWREIAARDRHLGPLARRAQVGSLVAAGRPGDARLVLRELVEADGLRPWLELVVLVGDGLRREGDHDGAASLYLQVLDAQIEGLEADAARLGLAALREAAGDPEKAIELLRQAQLRHRDPATYAMASARERSLASRLGRSPERFAEDEYLALSRRLSRNSRFPAALTVLNEWRLRHPGSARADQIDADAVENLYDQRANDQARARIERFRLDHPDSPLLPRVHLTDFRLDAREGRTAGTIRKGYELWRGEVPGATLPLRQSAGLLLGAYLVSVGRVVDGMRLFDELVETMEDGIDRTTIRWRAAVAALRAGLDEPALERFRTLAREELPGDLGPATLYWLGVAEERVGNRRAALEAWVRLEQRHPYDYYGRRAIERLARQGQDLQPATAIAELRKAHAASQTRFPAAAVSQAAQDSAELRAARVLSRAGLRREALAAARQALDRRRSDLGLALLTARAASAAGEHRLAHALLATHFGQFLEQPALNLPEDFWPMLYPQPFPLHVRRAAADHQVDPLLLYAVMRQESQYDRQARSSVGAIGLFQIMPATAERLSPFTGLPSDEDSLLEPEVNARYAAALLSRLELEFDGALAPAVAAYNAGAERAYAWWSAARGVPEDLFIDSIPYTETRRFVRAVLNNYLAYRQLAESAAAERP